jgi:hypothetical protein
VELDHALHLVARAEDQRHVLVDVGRREVEDAVEAVRGRAARLFQKKGEGRRLVEQPQPPPLVAAARVARVKVNPAAQQDAIGLGDDAAEPARVVVHAAGAVHTGDAFLDEDADGQRPVARVGGVDRVFAARLGDADFGAGEAEHAVARVQGEDAHALAEGQCEGGVGPVEHEPRRELAVAGGGKGERRVVAAFRGHQRKHRAHRGVGVDVVGAVERIHRHRDRAAGPELHRALQLLRSDGGHRRAAQAVEEEVVRADVQRLLAVAVAACADHRAQVSGERPARDDLGELRGAVRDRGDRLRQGSPPRAETRPAVEMLPQRGHRTRAPPGSPGGRAVARAGFVEAHPSALARAKRFL